MHRLLEVVGSSSEFIYFKFIYRQLTKLTKKF